MNNLLNPIKAVSDYRAGLISPKGVLIRKCVLVVFLLLYVPTFFLPTDHLLYDVSTGIIFLALYVGVPFFINKKIDGKDFYARLSVVHTPIFIDGLILMPILFTAGLLTGVISLPSMIDPRADTFAVFTDVIVSVFSVVLMTTSFKRYK